MLEMRERPPPDVSVSAAPLYQGSVRHQTLTSTVAHEDDPLWRHAFAELVVVRSEKGVSLRWMRCFGRESCPDCSQLMLQTAMPIRSSEILRYSTLTKTISMPFCAATATQR